MLESGKYRETKWIKNNGNIEVLVCDYHNPKEWIGEVNIHWNNDKKWYEMGIVLESKYRGMRYSVEALKNLISVAFDEYNAPAIHNYFEIVRESAIALHKAAGFNIINEANGIVELLITREDYFNS
jgi:RimJ/RimL family protein N-acetyltransferase